MSELVNPNTYYQPELLDYAETGRYELAEPGTAATAPERMSDAQAPKNLGRYALLRDFYGQQPLGHELFWLTHEPSALY